MRKKLTFFTGVMVAAALFIATTVLAEAQAPINSMKPITLIVDGEELQPDVPPQVMEQRTMVPLRWVAEALGAKVDWDESSHSVLINKAPDVYENPLRYAQLPEEITSPKMLLDAYFATLSVANHLTPEQMGAAGGTLGLGSEPYAVAYKYWSAEWRNDHTYEEYLHAWSGTAHVELIQLYEASMKDGQAQFFVETKHLEAIGDEPRFGEFYYSGFFTVAETEEGWKITSSNLKPQNLAWELGGHQPWLADPEQVAIIDGLGREKDAERTVDLSDSVDSKLIYHTENHVTVTFADDDQHAITSVELVRPREGIWQVIALEQEVPFSYYVHANDEIRYSKEEIEVIEDFSQTYGIEPLLPEKGLASDYLVKVRLRKNAMEFVYPHFSVTQSNRDLMSSIRADEAELFTMPNGEQAWWLQDQRILYIAVDGVYISLGSAKSAGKDELVRIAQSLKPVGMLFLESTTE